MDRVVTTSEKFFFFLKKKKKIETPVSPGHRRALELLEIYDPNTACRDYIRVSSI
jgi:hypothetical protein